MLKTRKSCLILQEAKLKDFRVKFTATFRLFTIYLQWILFNHRINHVLGKWVCVQSTCLYCCGTHTAFNERNVTFSAYWESNWPPATKSGHRVKVVVSESRRTRGQSFRFVLGECLNVVGVCELIWPLFFFSNNGLKYSVYLIC